MDSIASTLPMLLMIAWLLPLASFVAIVLFGPKMGVAGRLAGYVATGAIVFGFVLSLIALVWLWVPHHYTAAAASHATEESAEDTGHAETATDSADHEDSEAAHGDSTLGAPAPPYYSGEWYTLGEFGSLKLTIGYYIDALTVVMFCMVTLIASCIHFYAMGYMHEELEDVTDHEVTLADGEHLTRPGRYHRFFQYLSLFCFSMLGVVISGNMAMTFVFWELVGICSYFLIGFYIERKSASNAANKAFIVNRVGDFGMLIGMMIIWSSLGTFNFGDGQDEQGHVILNEQGTPAEPGIFSLVRPAQLDGEDNHHALRTPEGLVRLAAREEVATIVREHADQENGLAAADSEIAARVPDWRADNVGYWLLVVAGLGIFCGCVGKSAQFPLHTWLPDAMEGPTPVSALVHSATMVAAGVFLVGRFYPFFAPEVLLVIAVIGCFTLFMAATIAITATDIKRVLAYSTLSQLGYMMFALGVGGWLAGLFHLITHAFFKSLLFLCSGSVIHAVHSNEMTDMGGLLKKMPYTAYTMLVGCLAIIGAGIPLVWGLSGYYSKDAILAQALWFRENNATWGVMFFIAAGGAAITSFYMFRLWFMTFLGEPRDAHRYEHAHESPKVMVVPLLVLALFAAGVAWPWFGLAGLLESARPAGTGGSVDGALAAITIPAEAGSHAAAIHIPAGLIAFGTAASGFLLACCIYWWRLVDPEEIRRQFRVIYRFLINKWWFDELYDVLFVKPLGFVSRKVAETDLKVIDRIVDGSARTTVRISGLLDLLLDQKLVDGFVNNFASKTWSFGLTLRRVQTGRLREYVLFIVLATVVLFVLISLVQNSLAG